MPADNAKFSSAFVAWHKVQVLDVQRSKVAIVLMIYHFAGAIMRVVVYCACRLRRYAPILAA